MLMILQSNNVSRLSQLKHRTKPCKTHYNQRKIPIFRTRPDKVANHRQLKDHFPQPRPQGAFPWLWSPTSKAGQGKAP